MTDRPITEADIQAHVDGRLDDRRDAAVAAWLLGHPVEAARVAAYRRDRDVLRSALEPVLHEPVPAALDLQLSSLAMRSRRGLQPWLVAASMAGLLALGGAGGWTMRGWNIPATVGTAALAREATASYAVYANDAVRPVELAASQKGQLDAWFSRRLARTIRAPDLSAAGLTLVGGRLVAAEHGPAGLYLYSDRAGRRIALYVRPMEVDKEDRMRPRQSGSIGGWTWADAGLGFGMVGPAMPDALHHAADLVRAQARET